MRVRDYTRVNKMCDTAVAIANDNSHGYSQARRWPSEGTDYDCSSLVYWCANQAGYNVTIGPAGVHYTGSMLADFKAAGFRADTFDGNLNDLDKGDILLNSHHTALYIGDGKIVEASIAETGGVDGKPGDQTGHEIHVRSVYGGWEYVLTAPEDYKDDGKSKGAGMYGIDVSSHDEQPFKSHTEACYKKADFVIVKVTQATSYINPTFDYAINRAYKDGKLIGIYHYAGGNNAEAEARYFYDHMRAWVGKALPVLDWESYQNNAWGDAGWCKRFCDAFHKLSGVYPMIYIQASALWQAASAARNCPLWIAGYPSWTGDNWNAKPEQMPYDIGAWDDWAVWQYTSDGGTDRNVSNIDSDTWLKLAGAKEPTPTPATKHAEVQLYDSNGTDAQKWFIKWYDDTWFSLINVACGLALDVVGAGTKNGTQLWVYTYNGTDAQRFKLEESDSHDFHPSIIRPLRIVPKVNTKARVDYENGKAKNGTKIQIWGKSNTKNQEWVIKDTGNGMWVIEANDTTASAKALDVVGGGK